MKETCDALIGQVPLKKCIDKSIPVVVVIAVIKHALGGIRLPCSSLLTTNATTPKHKKSKPAEPHAVNVSFPIMILFHSPCTAYQEFTCPFLRPVSRKVFHLSFNSTMNEWHVFWVFQSINSKCVAFHWDFTLEKLTGTAYKMIVSSFRKGHVHTFILLNPPQNWDISIKITIILWV